MENIQKEAVELNNSYFSSSSNKGISAGATIGYGNKIQTTGNGASISANRSNQNTVETIHANGNFQNVNEVHNNTKNMTLRGFNQEGGKVTGTIENLEVISLQNTSTTTGSSKGMSVGVSASGIPNSIGLNYSNTNGERGFVDNQSTFIAGEGSSLAVGKATNTGAVIGKQGENSTLKINEYTGKDINNYDTMRTTGVSVGLQTGNIPISNIGYSQDSRDKEGISRNTVIGNVEIGTSTGAAINKDLNKANETTRDDHSSTNINVESQTIEYAVNPDKLKEDIGKAKQEIADVTRAFKESVNDRGDDNRNFFGQLSEVRLDETVENTAGEKLKNSTLDSEISEIYRMALKDLGYDNVQIIFSDPKNSPQLIDEKGKPKSGTAFVDGKGVRTIIINAEDPKNSTRSGLIGTLTEEGSHIIGKVEGRQIATGTAEKGLESTGRATNEYFQDKYKGDDVAISIQSDGKDYSNVYFGENVGDRCPDPTRSCMMATGYDRGQVIETNTSKNYRQHETEFKKIYQKMKYYCSSTGECKEKNGVFVFKSENAFYTYHSLFSKIGQRDRVKLDYEEEKSTLGERAEKIASGVLDMGIGNLTASVGIGLIGASGIVEALSGGTLTPLAAVTAGAGITATGVGGNKVISGVSKIGDGLFGNKEQVTGNSFNPLRDATGALTGKPEYYDGFELVTEIGAAGIAPYIPMLSAINHSSLKVPVTQKINDFSTPSSNKNVKYTPKESEIETYNRVKEMYKGDSSIKVTPQVSYKDSDISKYGAKGSVRPELSVEKNGTVFETYEVKNYDQKNYSSMTSSIGKQAIQRANNLPETAVQKIVIDVRGQNVTPEMREKVIDDIIRKSNNIIDKNNIMFME